MNASRIVLLFVLGIGLGAAGGYWSAKSTLSSLGSAQVATPAEAAERKILYYRDPNGAALWSAEPKKDQNDRDYLPVHDDEEPSFDEPQPKPQMAKAPRKILYYRNPMGLPDTSPVPKKDSMGMDYIPVYAGEEKDAAIVKIEPGKLQRTGVRSEAVSDRVITRQVRVPGTIQLDERRVSVVATRSDSFIDKVENVTTGDLVRKGQPLLELYSPEINAAAAQLVAAPGYDGSRRRLRNLNVQGDVIAQIERTRNVPRSFPWLAPRDGYVLERNVVEGMKATAGDVLFRIADISMMWVLADVPEYDTGAVKPGQDVTIRVRGLPGQTFTGRVNLIYPQVNKETRTTKVRIEIANPENLLRPDMYADVEIAAGTGNPVLAVADSAVIDTGTRQIVILDKGEGRFEPRPVSIGAQGGGFTEIRKGISSGDRVVVAANFLIDAESNLKAALNSMAAAESAP